MFASPSVWISSPWYMLPAPVLLPSLHYDSRPFFFLNMFNRFNLRSQIKSEQPNGSFMLYFCSVLRKILKDREGMAFYFVSCASWDLSWLCRSEGREGWGHGNIWNTADSGPPLLTQGFNPCGMSANSSGGPRGCPMSSHTPLLPQESPARSVSPPAVHHHLLPAPVRVEVSGFCWKVREDASVPFGWHGHRETPCQFEK